MPPGLPEFIMGSYYYQRCCNLLPRARLGYRVWGVLSPGHMASAGARAYNGGLGAEPLVRGSAGRSPPEAENVLLF